MLLFVIESIVLIEISQFIFIVKGRSCVLERLVSILGVVHRDVAASPVHLDAFLKIGSRYLKVPIRNGHLRKGRLRLPRAHAHLLQKVIKRSYQILTKVKVIVIHPRRQYQAARTIAAVMQLLRVLVRYQVVLHAVHQEGRRGHLLDPIDILEPVLNQIL